MKRTEVAVAGGGIVGAAAAALLARDGWQVTLLERGSAPPPPRSDRDDLRVYAIAPAAQRLLAECGAWDIAATRGAGTMLGACAIQRMEVWDAQPERPLVFSAAQAGVPALGHIVSHEALLHACWQVLQGVNVLSGTAPRALRLDEPVAAGGADSVLELADGAELAARLVLGADGADSAIRRLADIDCHVSDYGQAGVVCHVRTQDSHGGTALQRFLPGGPLALLPLADGRCSIVWSTATAHAAELQAMDAAQFCQTLGAASQWRLGPVLECSPRLSFPLRLQHAQAYARAGVALAGDAAHVIHPLAGQGLNLGLADVGALRDALQAGRAAGRAPGNARSLARWARERRAANLEMIAVTDGLFRMFGARAPVWDAVRNLGMALVDRSGPVKQELVRRALGFG